MNNHHLRFDGHITNDQLERYLHAFSQRLLNYYNLPELANELSDVVFRLMTERNERELYQQLEVPTILKQYHWCPQRHDWILDDVIEVNP